MSEKKRGRLKEREKEIERDRGRERERESETERDRGREREREEINDEKATEGGGERVRGKTRQGKGVYWDRRRAEEKEIRTYR